MRSSTVAPRNFVILTLCYLERFSSISTFKIESPIITQVPGDRYLGLVKFYLIVDFDTYQILLSIVIVLVPAVILNLVLTA